MSSALASGVNGEHFTLREVLRFRVNLLLIEDGDVLREKGVVRTLYDPACGTGGMLSVAEEYLRELNPDPHQELVTRYLNEADIKRFIDEHVTRRVYDEIRMAG